MTPRWVRAAWAFAVVLALLGVTLRVWPAPVPQVEVEAPEPYRVPEQPTGSEQAATLLSFQDIVSGDLFAPDRTAADERYVPPELAQPDTARPAPVVSRPTPPDPTLGLRLFGTAVGPEGSVALIDADPAVPGAEVYRVGDRVGAATLVEIQETSAVLDGPAGRFTLVLPTSLRR